MGLPKESTEAIVGTPVVAVCCCVLPFPHPSQYRKMPFRAQSVSTTGLIVWRCRSNCWSYNVKKNVLFFTIGPPTLPVNSFRLIQVASPGFHTPLTTCLLFCQVFASRTEFRMNHAPLPRS